MGNSQLPEDLTFDILLRLPVKSLLKFRSVCKSWCFLIDSSSFIKQHLLRPDYTNNDSLIVMQGDQAQLSLISGQNMGSWEDLHPCEDNKVNSCVLSNLVGSCNGIICLSDPKMENIALWNPATKQLTLLPESPSPSPRDDFFPMVYLVFGYDVKSDNYKVVSVIQWFDPSFTFAINLVEKYSLQRDSWTTIEAGLLAHFHIVNNGTVYLNGHHYWLVCLPQVTTQIHKCLILSFDISDEVFGSMSLPDALCCVVNAPALTLLRDSIACFDYNIPGCCSFDVWVLNEYGVKESWIKLYTIKLTGPSLQLRALSFTKNGEFLLLNYRGKSGKKLIILIDPKKQEIIRSFGIDFKKPLIYKESLISIKKECI